MFLGWFWSGAVLVSVVFALIFNRGGELTAEALSEAAKGLIEQIPQNKREEIYDLVKKGEKIKAIEKVREIGGFGLAEAKRLVDDLQQNLK